MKRILYLILTLSLLLSPGLLLPRAASASTPTNTARHNSPAARNTEAVTRSSLSATAVSEPPTPPLAPSAPPRSAPWFLPAHESPTGTIPGLYAPEAVTLGSDWSNAGAWACITPLGIVYNAAFGAGLTAPAPWDTIAGVTEYATNLALKFCGPVLYPPSDFPVAHEIDEDGRCSWTFNQPIWDGQYKNFLGITLPWGDVFPGKEWGDLGEPVVVHWNTDVDVSLEAPLAQSLGNDRYRLPVGNHRLLWRGDTQISPLDFVYTYIPGWAWTKLAKKYKLEDLTKQVAEQTTDAVIDLVLGSLDAIPTWSTMYNEEIQRVAVTDRTAPRLSGPATVQLEAIEPGGLSRSTYLYHLQRTLSLSDNCDGDPDLFPDPSSGLPEFVAVGDSASVTWLAEDRGPRGLDGGSNSSNPVAQTFTVADTLAPIIVPPPDIVTETTTLPASIRLGNPGVFDLADLNPTVSHNACSLPGVVCSGDSIHFPAGKTTVTWTAVDHAGNRSNTSQYVNVKGLGSNNAPSANGTSANAVSYEPITLTLQANDPDGDRLWFEIEQQPAGGFFRAPLYPYFIQDYRLANVQEVDFGEYCSDPDHYGDYIEANWPVDARFMAVDDEGVVYVQDEGIVRCNSFEPGTSTNYRLAIFRPDGTWEEVSSSFDVKDMQVDLRNEILYVSQHGVGGANPTVILYDLDLNPIARYRTDYSDPYIREPKNVAIDPERNLLYLTDGFLNIGSATLILMQYDPTAPESDDDPEGIAEYEGYGSGPHAWQDLALDSEGNLYASEREGDRIYKWSAPTINEDGSVTPGDVIGWMGRCDSGPGCDQANGRSFGFSCTPSSCTVSESSGNRPGQFDFPRGIAFDNNDILYVTDYRNYRVQRFTPEGFFAGQAVSECDGSCFVLGDFGRPVQVTVNSNHFYVLDGSEDLLHVFETSPITRLTDDSAEMVYQSDNNFVGQDSFSYRVSDGLDESAPATVALNVTRNYRPPTAIGPLAATTVEDNEVELAVDGYDPDAELDTLIYQTVAPPQNGTFDRQGNRYFYQPDPDFAGTDVFSYAAWDGVFLSPPQTVTVTVTPVNDPVRYPEGNEPKRPGGFVLRTAGSFSGLGRLAPLGTADDPLRVGRGFNTAFNVIWEDPDAGDRHMVVVHWGDGSAPEAEGELLDDGTMTGPVLGEGQTGGMGSVTAEHVFNSSGNFTVDICVSDNVAVDGEGNKSLTAQSTTRCLPLAVQVAPMVDLLVDIRPSANPYPAGSPLSYDLVVTNNAPDSGAGLTASGLRIEDQLDTRLSPGSVTTDGGSCNTSGYTITCDLDPLPPGISTTVHIPVQVPSSIQPGMVLGNYLTFAVDQENQAEVQENGELVTVVAPADYIVNTYGDEADENPGDGVCATVEGGCSLRAAVAEANLKPGRQTISLADWQLMLAAEIEIGDDLALTGLGAGRTVIGGTGEGRLFNIKPNVSVTLDELTLQNGAADGHGGALYNLGSTTLTDVQISGNQATGHGGAIYNAGTLTIRNSAVTGNDADGGAGGIANDGTLTLENVTVSGNQGHFGGLSNTDTATLENVTVARNYATATGGGLLNPSGVTLTVRYSIIANNSADGGGPDCDGVIGSARHSLLGNTSGCTINSSENNIVNQSPRLAPLARGANNTMAHPLRGGSPAIDAGSCQLTGDQDGTHRPIDGDLDGSAACDMGASEFEPSATWLPIIVR